jgi:hypothetical protein
MTHRNTVLTLGAMVLASTMVGCGVHSLQGESVTAIRINPTPSEMTLTQTQDDIDNRIAITYDENWLMFNQDLGRLMLLERPSRLAFEPIAY